MTQPFATRLAMMRSAASQSSHGVRARYSVGCRCMLCRAANSRYETERAARRAVGDSNELVDASRARAHLKWLSNRGIGRHSVQAASDVSDSILWMIVTGERTRIRRRTHERILAVDEGARAGRSLVSGKRARSLIRELVNRGYTKAELARRLGRTTPALQFLRTEKITARTDAAVDRLYRSIERGVMKPGLIK